MFAIGVNEKKTIAFAKDLLDYYSLINNGCNTKVLTSKDEESARNNVAWYYHDKGTHNVNINVPNLLALKPAIARGEIDKDAYYALVAIVVGHEFRHFLQGECIWDGKEIDGFGQGDVINSQVMMYIRFFFDAYYLINKGFVKYEIDAEKFAVKESIKFLKDYFPNMNVEKAIVDAVRHYATIQIMGGTIPTLPDNAKSTDEIIWLLDERISDNLRVDDLRQTLFVHNPRFFNNHLEFGLDDEKLYTNELLEAYVKENDGSKKDLVVAKAILDSVDLPVESMRDFPALRKAYIEKRL